MKVNTLFLTIVLSAGLGYLAGWEVAASTDSKVGVVRDFNSHHAKLPTSNFNVRTPIALTKGSAILESKIKSPGVRQDIFGHPLDYWKALVPAKLSADRDTWLRQRASLYNATWPESTDEWETALSRWQGADPSVFDKLAKATKDHSGKATQDLFDENSQKSAFLEQMSSHPFTGDWITTADFIEKQNVSDDRKSEALARAAFSWAKAETPEIAAGWLTDSQIGREGDRARSLVAGQVFSANPTAALSLLDAIRDPELRETSAIAIASKLSDVNAINKLSKHINPETLAALLRGAG